MNSTLSTGTACRCAVFSGSLAAGPRYLKPGLPRPAVLLIIGLAAWFIWSAFDSDSAESGTAQSSPAFDRNRPPPVTLPLHRLCHRSPPINGSVISLASRRRGGPLSKALVTFTLRKKKKKPQRLRVQEIDWSVAVAAPKTEGHLDRSQAGIPDTVVISKRPQVPFRRGAGLLVNVSVEPGPVHPFDGAHRCNTSIAG